MLDELERTKRVVGLKQTVRSIEEKLVEKVFLARDVSPNIYNKIVTLCSMNNIDIEYVDTMKELGNICKIDVSAAVAAIIKG